MRRTAKAWLDFAHRDLEAARILVHNEYVANVVLFHSQQCMEKCLKAMLEQRDLPVPHIHSVVKLHALLPKEASSSLSVDDDELDQVDAVYVDTRYPSGLGLLPTGFPTKKDAEKLLNLAEKIYAQTTKDLED